MSDAIGILHLRGASGDLAHGGTFVTLKSPGTDFSIIVETKDARQEQTVEFSAMAGLSLAHLAVWRNYWKRGPMEQAAYAMLLPAGARQIQVINVTEPSASSGNLPRVLGPQSETEPLQWTAMPQAALPIVLMPRADGRHGGKATRFVPRAG